MTEIIILLFLQYHVADKNKDNLFYMYVLFKSDYRSPDGQSR